ncbi:MAG: serine hydrolase domain-containing protein [Candidatus Aminicenantales bacterium]
MRRISSSPPVARLILLVAVMTALSQAAAGIPPGPEPSLESKVDALFSKWNTLDSPGAAVAIVKDGLVIYRKGFGCAQLEYGVPITPSTVFHVASVSKQFTAMAITMLEEQGKLSADDDIRKYLTELADFGKTITIRHLLNHTSGLRDQWDLLVLSGWRMDDVITQAHIMDRLRRQKELNFPPGEQYMYSNSGFTLLAEIVSRVSGRPFTEWTRENIFLPLGMTSTHFHLDHKEIVRNRAYSYEGDAVKGFKQSVLNYANVGATSLFTTVEDMASWLRNFDEKRVGGAAVLDKMLTKGVLNNGTEIPYARGIEVAEYKGLKTIGHSGGDAGFRSHVLYFPGEKFGVAVFSNLASFDPGAMSRQIADIYLASQLKQPEPAPPAAKAPLAKPALKPVILPVKSLEAFVGTYWIEATQLLRKIVVNKDKLIYVRSDDNKTELVPVFPTSFKMKDIPNNVYVTFSDKTANHFDTYTVTGENEPTAVGKWIEPFLPTEEALKKYAGRYYSDELDTRYDLVVKSGALHVQIGHNEGIPVLPLKKDVFSAGGLANIRFQRDGNGAITGLMVSTGRVKNLKFAKLPS